MKKILKLFKRVTIALAIGALAAVAAILVPLAEPPFSAGTGTFLIENVSVIDVESGASIENANVVFGREGIHSIGTGEYGPVPPDFTVIDGRGLYLMPGLWDMHTHGLKLSPQLHHPLFILNGVTSVRDMSGCLDQEDSYWACPEDRESWEEKALEGVGISPRYPQQSSFQVNGGNEVPGNFSSYFRLQTFDDAMQTTRFFQSQGVDFIKTYTELSEEQFENLSIAARDRGLDLAGHKPLTVSLEDALSANMKSIEHGRLFMFECYGDIDSFRALDNPLSMYDAQKIREIVDLQDAEECDNAMKIMAQSEAYWVPTLTTLKMSAMANEASFIDDPRLAQIPYLVEALIWNPDINRAANLGFDDQGNFVHGDYFASVEEQISKANVLGIKILAGTDNIDTYVFTGSSLHDELEMLVQAGLTPLQALRSATIEAAEFSQLDHKLGSVKVGKKADLVLLSANPLDDITSTRSIVGVVFNGYYFKREALEELQQYTNDMASSFRVNLRYLADLIMSPLMRVQLAD